MQVAHQTDHVTHAVIGGKGSIEFGISSSAEFFNILSSTLYKDQILAVVREVLCNARDAHIEAGCVDRRGYVKDFSGSVCVLAKVAPEDVIAVPSYDANKMRVCGYHIIDLLTKEQHDLVRANKPITDNPAGKILLGKAIAGQHIGKTHEVRITGHMGAGVQVTELMPAPKANPVTKAQEAVALSNNKKIKDAPVDPKAVANKVEQLSRKDIAASLYAEGKVDELKALKKQAKVSWEKLGVPDPDVTPPVVNVFTALKELPARDIAAEVSVAGAPFSELTEGSAKERIHKLLAIGLTSVGVAQAIRELKKKSKKSWDVLGVSAEQVERITTLV